MRKIGIAGFGTIGRAVGRWVLQEPDLALVGVVGGDPERAAEALKILRSEAPILKPADLAQEADIIVDTAPTAAFRDIVVPALTAGRCVVTVSAAALIENMDVVAIARQSGGRIIMATGALLGLDAVRAAAKGTIHSVIMVTRKPPRSLVGAPEVIRQGVDLTRLTEPLMLFDGSAREGARGFPANVNVAAALALAGIGPDRTRLQIWADPKLERNTHRILVDADSASFELSIQNVPTVEKPGTGRITALSVIAAVEGLTSPLKVGT